MVLTRSTVTINNVQEEAPWPTALEWQIQTLMATVERLTKQNHDLEEQLCQRNTGHNTQEEDQEGTSTDKVSYAAGGELWPKQGPFGSLGILQNLDAPSGDPRRNYVQSLSHHVEGTRKGLVQQADAQLY